MQFVSGGPDIPERLLQAHEDGRVVFFCGAGISSPAGLPGFSGLVDKLYQALSVTPGPEQQLAIDTKQFDTAIGLLEADMVGGRETVRRKLAEILTPKCITPNATTTHEALLELAKNRQGHIRLITTNFDRLFEEVRAVKPLSFPTFKAPLLPMPKARWDGLVYLHGLLPVEPITDDLNQLVVSSGDFGLAYLVERWAARFISELFRNFTVCFIGYSISDPILRYMLDALAADRLLGESPRDMFAFGNYSKNKEEKCASEWRTKNVTPILYRSYKKHFYLHKTLRAWAETYRDGVRGKEHIVVKCAITRPSASTKQDDFVGRMLWALSDPSGVPAKRFAEFDPAPPLDWLRPLSRIRYRHADLRRFGVVPQTGVSDDLAYSLTCRPAPYSHAPWMLMVDDGYHRSDWDKVMFQLARWLLRHLDDPKLLHWIIKSGGQLHDRMIWLIEHRFDELDKLTSDGNTTELERIRANAPGAIPRPAMRVFWSLLLNGHITSELHGQTLERWARQFRRDGLTVSARLALREILKPYVLLSEPYIWPEAVGEDNTQEYINRRIKWEVVLAVDDVGSSLHNLSKNEQWTAALPELLDDFNSLLRDALDLMRELGEMNGERVRSHIHRPSISDHPQNKNFRDWTVLIELTRDAWLATAVKSPERAQIMAETWAHGPCPVFRRLAFFAAAQEGIISSQQAINWLLTDERRWLWSAETKRETIRLLVSLIPQLDEKMQVELEQAILFGPPRNLYPDITPIEWDHAVWLRLAKTAQAGATFSEAGQSRLDTLSAQYPWQLETDERDEFNFWIETTQAEGRYFGKTSISIPRTKQGMLDYLLAHPEPEDPQQDNWRELCSKMFEETSYALRTLAQRGIWPVGRWRDALQAWMMEEKLWERSWRCMAPVIMSAPDDRMQSLADDISWWLEAIAETINMDEKQFLSLAQRILQLDFGYVDVDDPMLFPVNYPIDRVTQALLLWWSRQTPDEGPRLAQSIKTIFTELCNTQIAKFRDGRIVLAVNAELLFWADEEWSEQYLLPLFDWGYSNAEALAAWTGYLRSPQLSRPWMEAIKSALLDTVNHYVKLGIYSERFATLLTFAALDLGDIFAAEQLATAIRALPESGLHASAQTLLQALGSAGEQRESYWKNRILPFWENIWPKSNDQVSSIYAESLALLCIEAGNEFPSAVATIVNWLRKISHPERVIHRLHETGLSKDFPEDVLRLLSAILDENSSRLPLELRQCLDAIAQVVPNLCDDHRFRRIDELARKSTP